ncbi:hypothetical protein [Eubacterium pyruvativorans]|nr:hypothetical protein [Eubacterium pyruvativorans]
MQTFRQFCLSLEAGVRLGEKPGKQVIGTITGFVLSGMTPGVLQ